MRKVIFALGLLVSSVATADPSWFDRRQATYTAHHLHDVYMDFYGRVAWEYGSYHPVSRSSYAALGAVEDIHRDLETGYPFSPIYDAEKYYYRTLWVDVQRQYARIGIPDWDIQDMYTEIGYLSDKLHKTFNSVPALVSCLASDYGHEEHWIRTPQGWDTGHIGQGYGTTAAQNAAVSVCRRAHGSCYVKRCWQGG